MGKSQVHSEPADAHNTVQWQVPDDGARSTTPLRPGSAKSATSDNMWSTGAGAGAAHSGPADGGSGSGGGDDGDGPGGDGRRSQSRPMSRSASRVLHEGAFGEEREVAGMERLDHKPVTPRGRGGGEADPNRAPVWSD
ncbi:hypothetical protein FOA52_004784 [Chlamydomonas sp. UWO 241]|nr:hypothetical protein FOA52_004784 [Chlamydomonas sp. UWO 241]